MAEDERTDAPQEKSGADSTRSAPAFQWEPELQRVADIPVTVSVELDRKRVRLREVLELRNESVIKMGRSAGENVDLLVEGRIVANGEIVVIEDTMGLRVTDLAGTVPSGPGADDDT